MFPHIKIFFLQTKRNTRQTALQLIFICIVASFFTVSMNLYSNSIRNLQTVENAYTTIATMEIYGYVNKVGELVHPSDETCVGRHLLSVNDYDLSNFLDLNPVKSIDLRTRVGAYIPGNIPVYCTVQDDPFLKPDLVQLFGTQNVIRFMLDSEEPMVILLQDTEQNIAFPIRILEMSNPLLEYPNIFTLFIPAFDADDIAFFSEDIRRLNRSDCINAITLYPDVEYVMATYGGKEWEWSQETGAYIWRGDGLSAPYAGLGFLLYGYPYYNSEFLGYDTSGITKTTILRNGPLSLQRYEDVNDNPIWAEYALSATYNSSSFTVTLTENISLIPAWHQGTMFLTDGRMITEEEYNSGAKVCMVSAKMAANQRWRVGDKLDMHLYSYAAFYDEIIKNNGMPLPENYIPPPSYLKDCGGFFEEDTYEIVGIFGQREFTGLDETAEEVFYNPWNTIYIPANAAPNAPEGPIQPSLITIELQNGSINAFKKAVQDMGLTDQKTGEYEIKFSYFDQGYSKIQPGLMEMNHNAKLLLALSGLLLLVTMMLMSFLFAQQHKHSAGILRLLGGSKGQAFSAILACATVVVATSGIMGAILGGALTQSVGASILGNAESTVVELATGANPVLTALTALGCIMLFLCLTSIFVGTYIGKEPSALLPSANK